MFQLRQIDALDAPELAPYRNLRAQWDHLHQGVFVAEGEKVVRRLLASALEVRSVLLPPHWLAEYEPLIQQRPEIVDLFVASKELLMQLTGFSMYQGLLALGRIPTALSFDDLLDLPSPRLVVAVEGLSNAENVGAIVRNAAALGAQALIVGETSAHPYLRRAVRASMGTVFQLPYFAATHLSQTLAALRQHGFTTLAAHPRPDSRPPWELDLRHDVCLVLGAEGPGLTDDALGACSAAAGIPMAPNVDSLNVSHAAAALLSEILRQRRLHQNIRSNPTRLG